MDGCPSADTSPLFFSSGGGVSYQKFKVRTLTPIQVKCSNPNGSGGQAAPVYFCPMPEAKGDNNCSYATGAGFCFGFFGGSTGNGKNVAMIVFSYIYLRVIIQPIGIIKKGIIQLFKKCIQRFLSRIPLAI